MIGSSIYDAWDEVDIDGDKMAFLHSLAFMSCQSTKKSYNKKKKSLTSMHRQN